MRILVTGGAGFIGCAISQLLAPKADRYLVLDNLHPQIHPAPERPKALHQAAELLVGDIADYELWRRITDSFDVVIHLAAETGTGQSLRESARHAHVNVLGTTIMLDYFARREKLPPHFVLSSSRAIYGEGAWRLRESGALIYPGQRSHRQLELRQWDFEGAEPVPSCAGVTVPAPTSIYGATKLAQEHILHAWCRSFDIPLSILRLQNVYGPGQSLTNSYTGIVALFSQTARAGRSIPLYEDGNVTRDFVFIDDVATAFAATVAHKPDTFSCRDIGSGQATTIRQLAQSLADWYGSPDPTVTGQFRDGDVRHASCDLSPSTRSSLNWTPAWTLDAGLAALQAWIEETVVPLPH
jgi:dTDP-L-rhamnose 4-epimerase